MSPFQAMHDESKLVDTCQLWGPIQMLLDHKITQKGLYGVVGSEEHIGPLLSLQVECIAAH